MSLAVSCNMRRGTRQRIASWGDRETREVSNEIGRKPVDKAWLGKINEWFNCIRRLVVQK